MKNAGLSRGSLGELRKQSLEQQTYDALRKAILKWELEPGQRLVQKDVAELLGTSRIPVRDALKRLESDGLVVADARGTYTVQTFGPEDVQEIYDLRLLLEPLAAVKALERIERAELDELHECNEVMRKAAVEDDTEMYVATNREFHMQLYGISGQQRLIRIIESLWSSRPLFNPLESRGHYQQSLSEHEAIIDAMEAGDPEGVRRALEAHIAKSSKSIQERLRKHAI